MKTHYWIPTIEEAKEFKTYTYTEHPMTDEVIKFFKKGKPSICNVPSDLPHVLKEQQAWYDISNREDKIVLENEKEAFDYFYEKEMKDIKKYL